MVPAIWPSVCSQSGDWASAITIELPPPRKLALDLDAPSLALLGALLRLALAQDHRGDLARADKHARGAHRRVHAEGRRRLGGLARRARCGLERLQHRH